MKYNTQCTILAFQVTKQASREGTPRLESEATDMTRSYNATLPGLSDTEKWHYNQAIQAIEEKEAMESCEQEAANILQEIDTMLESKSDDHDNDNPTNEINTTDGVHQSEPTKEDSIHQVEPTNQASHPPETNVIPPSISSSVSSSEGSALNTTVIAAEGAADNERLKADTGEGFNPPFQSTAVGFDKSTKSTEQSKSQELTIEKKDLKMTDKLRESWAESESNMSLLGEYRELPTPISFENSESSAMQEKSVQNQDGTQSKCSNYDPVKYQHLSADDKEMSTLSTSHTLSGTHSTQLTLDTVGQSCTLPLSLFSSSSNSTLCEVQDPFASFTDTTTPLGEEGSRLIRGVPVGQESSNTESGSEPQVITNDNKDAINVAETDHQSDETQGKPDVETTSGDEYKSPPKRVRRNSYTLDHPSPALLDAQARNEAPYASDEGSPQIAAVDTHPGARRSLELGGTEQVETTKMEQISMKDQKKDQDTGLTPGDEQKGNVF